MARHVWSVIFDAGGCPWGCTMSFVCRIYDMSNGCPLNCIKYAETLGVVEVARIKRHGNVLVVYESDAPLLNLALRYPSVWKGLLKHPEAFRNAANYKMVWLVRRQHYLVEGTHQLDAMLLVPEYRLILSTEYRSDAGAELVNKLERILSCGEPILSKEDGQYREVYYGTNDRSVIKLVRTISIVKESRIVRRIDKIYDSVVRGNIDDAAVTLATPDGEGDRQW